MGIIARGLAVVAACGVAACGFRLGATGDAGDATRPDSPPPVVCNANQCRLRLDTDAELADAISLIDITVDPDVAVPADPARATLTPAAYVRGAVIARGSNTGHGSFGSGVDWPAIDTATIAGVSFGGTDLASSGNAPVGVGVTANDDWTYWIEGEVALKAGVSDIELAGDDLAALQIAPANTRAFVDVVKAEFPNPQVGTFDAGAGGWFPFRAAVVQTNGGGSGMRIRTATPTGGVLAPITRGQLRGRVDQLRGAFVVAWDDRLATGPATASLYTRPLLADQIDQPLAPGLTNADDLSQRWFGQLRATTAGDHRLTTISDDGNRVFLADQASPDRLEDTGGAVATDVTAALRSGWNDLVIDFSETGGGEAIAMTVTQAPTGGAIGGQIPVALLRPVMPRRNAFVTYFDPAQAAIPNNTTAGVDRVVTPEVLGAEIVTDVRVSYQIAHGMIGEVDVDLIHDGKTAVLRNSTTNGNRWHSPTTFDGGPLAGAWTLHVDDESGGMTGTLQSWTLTVFTQGGPGQIAERSEWISTVKDLELDGQVTEIEAIDAGLALPPGSTAELYVRSCATVIACDAAPWSGPHAPGAQPSVTAARYSQLRVVLTSNGVDEPTVDFVELRYRVAPP